MGHKSKYVHIGDQQETESALLNHRALEGGSPRPQLTPHLHRAGHRAESEHGRTVFDRRLAIKGTLGIHQQHSHLGMDQIQTNKLQSW